MKYTLNKQGNLQEITNISLEFENMQELEQIIKFNFNNYKIVEINNLLKIVTIEEIK